MPKVGEEAWGTEIFVPCCSSDGTVSPFPPPVEVWCLWIKKFTMFLALNSYLWIEAHTKSNNSSRMKRIPGNHGWKRWDEQLDWSITYIHLHHFSRDGNMYQHGRCDVACGKPSGGVMDVGAPLKSDAMYPIWVVKNGWNTSKIKPLEVWRFRTCFFCIMFRFQPLKAILGSGFPWHKPLKKCCLYRWGFLHFKVLKYLVIEQLNLLGCFQK